MTELDNLLGSKISLISQNDIRYEGVLFSINAKESSIILRDVRCLGTEDRTTSRVVNPNPQVLPFVSFPGAEIKDLYVHETEPTLPASTESAAIAEVNTPPVPPPVVPRAEVSNPAQTQRTRAPEIPQAASPVKSQPGPDERRTRETRETRETSEPREVREGGDRGGDRGGAGRRQRSSLSGERGGRGPGRAGRGRGGPQTAAEQTNTQTGSNPRPGSRPPQHTNAPPRSAQPHVAASTAGTGEHLLKMKEKKSDGSNASASAPVEAGTEFDFQASTSTFNKEDVVSELSSDITNKIKLYKKDDFFDCLSSDNSDRAEGKRTGLSHNMERSLNQDTFGAIALQSGYRRGGYGNYRGGGRGGDGRGYGRGRGRGRGATAAT